MRRGSRQTVLLARRTRTMKQCSFDACSKEQSAYSLWGSCGIRRPTLGARMSEWARRSRKKSTRSPILHSEAAGNVECPSFQTSTNADYSKAWSTPYQHTQLFRTSSCLRIRGDVTEVIQLGCRSVLGNHKKSVFPEVCDETIAGKQDEGLVLVRKGIKFTWPMIE